MLSRPLWFDELFTIWASRLRLRSLLEVLRRDSGPPLWYALEKPFVALGERLGYPPMSRALPFLATAALFLAVRALPSRAAKARYLVLAALSPLLLLYSAEARAYALLALECLTVFLLATRGEESPRRLGTAALVSAAALFTHYLALFAVAAVAVVAVAEKRRRSAVAVATGAVPFLAWVPVMRAQPHAAVAWMHEPPSELVTGILSSFGGAGDIPAPFGPPLPAALVWIGVALALLLGILLARQWRDDPEIRRAGAFLVLFFGGVLFASFARPVAFAGRTEMAVLPVWMWAVALGGERSRWTRIGSLAVALVAAVSSVLLLAAPRYESAPDRALEHLERMVRPGDVLFASAHLYLPARLAADRGQLRIPAHAFPAEQALHPGWSVPRWPGPPDAAAVTRALAEAGPEGRVFFLVPRSYPVALRPLLAGGGGPGRTRRLAESPEMLLLVWTAR
jgi:hypothetical protein